MSKSKAERKREVARLTAQACVKAWVAMDFNDSEEEAFKRFERRAANLPIDPLTAHGVMCMVEVYAAAYAFRSAVLDDNEGMTEHLSLYDPTALHLLEATPSALYDSIKASTHYLEGKAASTELPSQGQEE